MFSSAQYHDFIQACQKKADRILQDKDLKGLIKLHLSADKQFRETLRLMVSHDFRVKDLKTGDYWPTPTKLTNTHHCSTCDSRLNDIGSAVALVGADLVTLLWATDPSDYEDVDNPYRLAAVEMEKALITSVGYTPSSPYHLKGCNEAADVKEVGGFNHFYLSSSAVRALRDANLYVHEHHRLMGAIKSNLSNGLWVGDGKDLENAAKALSSSDKKYHRWADKAQVSLRLYEEFLRVADIVGRGPAIQFMASSALWNEDIYRVLPVFKLYGTVVGEFVKKYAENPTMAFRKLDEMVSADVYMRPTRETSQAAIEQAEEKIVSLGLQNSLQRRFLSKTDIQEVGQVVWTKPDEAPQEEEDDGPFAVLKEKKSKRVSMATGGVTKVSMRDFIGEHLPRAKRVTIHKLLGVGVMGCFTGPAQEGDRPIIKWDTEEQRNPYAWFFGTADTDRQRYTYPETVRDGLEVEMVTTKPSQWSGSDHYAGYAFILKDVHPRATTNNTLFPELLKPELYGIRAVIENFNRKTTMPDHEDAAVLAMLDKTAVHDGLRFDVDDGEVIQAFQIVLW